ncbi:MULTISPECIES: hypothetical protein [Streptomyces]|uniref:hypothetical protein n=1 Tax=Streptomyces TaxID=1883 RepID=UPI0012FF0A08|nr:hypothetical protein [Streptomyces exfoliatus]
MTMKKKATALAAGAVAAGALVLGGWFGYQHLEQQVGSGEVLRGYDAYTPAGTAPHSENVFTGRVAAFEERRDIDHWTTDIYRVDVVSALRGDARGTVRVPFAADAEPAQRLVDGETYVFATQAKDADGYWLMYQGEMKPVDDGQLAVWREAVALPMAPQESSSGS